MRIKIYTTLFILVFVMRLFNIASSQEIKNETPEPMKNFGKLVGKWVAKVSYESKGKHYLLEYHMDFSRIADGSGLYCDEYFTDPDLGSLKGGNLIGYDPNDKILHWYAVDNMGNTHDHICTWKSDSYLYMEHNSRRNGKSYCEKIDMIFNGNDEFVNKFRVLIGHRLAGTSEGIFKRIK